MWVKRDRQLNGWWVEKVTGLDMDTCFVEMNKGVLRQEKSLSPDRVLNLEFGLYSVCCLPNIPILN